MPVDFQYLFDAARRTIGYLFQCLTNNFRNSGERNPLVEECFHGYLIGRVQNTCSRAAGFLGLARALLRGRFHVDFEDVQALAVPVLRHRLVLNFQAEAEGVGVEKILNLK